MALLSEFFVDCVVAVGTILDSGDRVWRASGFLFGEAMGNNQYTTYFVTNRHVIENQKHLLLRFNPHAAQPAQEFRVDLFDGAGKALSYTPTDPTADVAVIPVDFNKLKANNIRCSFCESDHNALDRQGLQNEGVAEGDGVFVLGFPLGLVGGDRNFVVVRQGVVARIRDALAGVGSQFLIDASVFPGNSGGPVILKPDIVAITGTKSHKTSMMIGVASAYIPYRDVTISQQTGNPRVIFEENSGLAAVVLVDYIRDAIKQHLNVIAAQIPAAQPPTTTAKK
jgi:S1-C subfamily serine protease